MVLALVQRLPPDSQLRAYIAGRESYFGWSPERMLLADIYDAINLNTRMTGHWAKKPPEIPPAFRPEVDEPAADEAKPAGVKALRQRFLNIRR